MPLLTPEKANADLEATKLAIANNTAASKALADARTAIAGTGAIDKEGNTVDSLRAVQLAKLTAQSASLRVANAFGVDANAASDELARLANQYISDSAEARSAQLAAIKANKVVEEKSAVSLFDDPIGFIYNQITLGDDINHANDLAKEADAKAALAQTTAAQSQNINALTQQSAQTYNAIAQTVTVDSMNSLVAAAENTLKDQKLAAQQAALEQNTAALLKLQGLSTDQMSLAFNAKSDARGDAQLAMQRESHAAQMAAYKEESDARAAATKKARGQDAADAEAANRIITILKTGSRVLKVADPTLSIKDPKQLADIMKMDNEAGKKVRALYDAGLNTVMAGKPKIGITAADAIEASATFQQKVGTANQHGLLDLAFNNARALAAAQGIKDPSQVKALVNQQVEDLTKKMRVIKPNDPKNIFSAPTLKNIFAAIPNLTKLPGAAKIAELESKGLLSTQDPYSVAKFLAAAIQDKSLTYNQAKKLGESIYQGAVLTNNAAHNPDSIGLPVQTSYIVNVSSNYRSLFGHDTQSDLTRNFDELLNSSFKDSVVTEASIREGFAK